MRTGKSILIWYAAAILSLQQTAIAELSSCVTSAISAKPILPQTQLSDLNCTQEIDLSGTADEFIPASIVIHSSAALSDLTVTASSLSSSATSIPNTAIDFRYVKAWYQSGEAWQSIRQNKSKKVLTPELLLHNNELVQVDESKQLNFLVTADKRKIDINQTANKIDPEVISVDKYPISDSPRTETLNLKANTTQQIWLTLRVPASVQVGDYLGKVYIESKRNGVRIEIPISLTVYPFALVEPELIYSIYYRGILTTDNKGSVSSENKSIAQMTAELKNLKEHGISNPTVYQPPTPPELFDKVLQLRTDAGMDNSVLYYLGIQTPIPDNIWALKRDTDNFTKIQSIATKHRNNKLHVYAIDEADIAQIPKQKPIWSNYKSLGGNIFAADWKPGAENYYAGEIATLILGTEPNRIVNNFLRSKGTKTFLYNRPQVGVENPFLYRQQYGFIAWKNEFDGVMDYAYQHSMGDIWNDFDHPGFRDHVFAYPTTNGVVDTIAWEGFREGVTDVRYLTTLQKLATITNSTADLNYIAMLKLSPVRDLDSMRQTVAERITALCQKTSSQSTQQICSSSAPSPIHDLKIGPTN